MDRDYWKVFWFKVVHEVFTEKAPFTKQLKEEEWRSCVGNEGSAPPLARGMSLRAYIRKTKGLTQLEWSSSLSVCCPCLYSLVSDESLFQLARADITNAIDLVA